MKGRVKGGPGWAKPQYLSAVVWTDLGTSQSDEGPRNQWCFQEPSSDDTIIMPTDPEELAFMIIMDSTRKILLFIYMETVTSPGTDFLPHGQVDVSKDDSPLCFTSKLSLEVLSINQ